MALTRKMLKAMGIEEEKIEQIIDAHSETVDALKQERDAYKDDAQKLSTVQKELDGLKAEGGDWKSKYEKERSDFEAFKTAQTERETRAAKQTAYRTLLKEAGISEKRIDSIIKITNLDEIELDTDGRIKDAETHKQTVQTEYADFVETATERGADVANPPSKASDVKELGELSMKDYIAARKNK